MPYSQIHVAKTSKHYCYPNEHTEIDCVLSLMQCICYTKFTQFKINVLRQIHQVMTA